MVNKFQNVKFYTFISLSSKLYHCKLDIFILNNQFKLNDLPFSTAFPVQYALLPFFFDDNNITITQFLSNVKDMASVGERKSFGTL
jgi:hypothetical protein